jgi:hypothetical protein
MAVTTYTSVRRALYGKLAVSALTNKLAPAAPGYTWGIYHDTAPSDAEFPLVEFSKNSGTPTWVETFRPSAGTSEKGAFQPDDLLEQTEVWLVKAIVQGESGNTLIAENGSPVSGPDAAEDIADKIVELLDDGKLSLAGELPFWIRHQSDINYSEIADGTPFYHVGALFRIVITKKP